MEECCRRGAVRGVAGPNRAQAGTGLRPVSAAQACKLVGARRTETGGNSPVQLFGTHLLPSTRQAAFRSRSETDLGSESRVEPRVGSDHSGNDVEMLKKRLFHGIQDNSCRYRLGFG